MTLAELTDKFIGEWTGTNLLRFEPGGADRITDSTLSVSQAAGNFLTLAYTWSFDGAPQEGFMILGYDKANGGVSAAWGDSWHMSASLLISTGVIHGNGEIDIKGFYDAPSGPPWGWRTTLKATETGFLLEMYNCEPEGGEELAVRGDYSRQGGNIA